MKDIIVYGDFSCPCSYLASLRADRLLRSGIAGIDWRAVALDRRAAPASPQHDGGREERERPPDGISSLSLPGERLPHRLTDQVHVAAVVAAYAEAVSDGVQDQLRRRLFAAIWVEGRSVSAVYDVRRLIAEIMGPPEPVLPRLASRDLTGAVVHDPEMNQVVRRLGGTVTLYGGPLTAEGSQRIQQWRREWLALPYPVTPVAIDPAGAVLPRTDALRYLASVLEGGRIPLGNVRGRAAARGLVALQGGRLPAVQASRGCLLLPDPGGPPPQPGAGAR